MNTLFQTDKQRNQLYLAENEGWMKMLITQQDEIPGLKKMLTEESISKTIIK